MTKIETKGGNQYNVTIGDETRTIDLDGYTVVSDENEQAMSAAGLDTNNMYGGTLMCPAWSESSEIDPFFAAAVEFAANLVEFAANYSGFDVAEAIKMHKEI